jgi:hypothetical protein
MHRSSMLYTITNDEAHIIVSLRTETFLEGFMLVIKGGGGETFLKHSEGCHEFCI